MVCMERRVGFHFHATDRVMLYPRFPLLRFAACHIVHHLPLSMVAKKTMHTISTIDQRRRPNRLCA